MDGSLFFRTLTGILDFFRRVAAGSFILGLFFAPSDGAGQRKGLFENLLEKVLNGRFKPFVLPKTWPGVLSGIFNNSLVIGKLSKALDTPIPAGGTAGMRNVVMWGFFAFPAWGMAAVVLLTPVLSTMTLAYILSLIIVFTYLSRKFYVDRFTVVLFLFMFVNFFAISMPLTSGISMSRKAMSTGFCSA